MLFNTTSIDLIKYTLRGQGLFTVFPFVQTSQGRAKNEFADGLEIDAAKICKT